MIPYTVQLAQINFCYPNATQAENLTHPILYNITFDCCQGEIIAILGKNGAGKSTLLRCISGVFHPTTGKILIHGIDINKMSAQQLAQQVSILHSEPTTIFAYTVLEMVVMGRTPHLCWWEQVSEKDLTIAKQSLDTLQIGHLAERKVEELSSGERQMILLARTLCQSSSIILLDEPNAHLDLCNQWRLLQIIKKLAYSKKWTVLAVLHHPELAYWFADRIIILENGSIIADGKPLDTITSKNLSRAYGFSLSVEYPTPGHISIYPTNLAE